MTHHPRLLAILVVLVGLLVPASPAFAVGTPTVTTPAVTPTFVGAQVNLVWTQVGDATAGYEVLRGTVMPGCTDSVMVFSTALSTVTSYSETPADGIYCYLVRASDGVVTADSTPINVITRDATDPTASWVGPAGGALPVSPSTAGLEVNASDATSGVADVVFERQQAPGSGSFVLLGTDATPPYQASWSYGAATEGTYTLRATISDRSGNTTVLTRNVIVDRTDPTGTITVANEVRGSVALPATISDGSDGSGIFTTVWVAHPIAGGSDITIGSALFGTPSSVTWDTTTVADGSYQLSLGLIDNSGNTGTSIHTPNVLVDNTPPTSATLTPLANAEVGATPTLTATASDAGTGVGYVTFQYSAAGANVYATIATDSAAPFTQSWDTTALTEGLYDLRAIVGDGVGNVTTVNSANVRVDRTAPVATLGAPAAGSAIRGTVSVTPGGSDGGSGVARIVTEYTTAGGSAYTTISDRTAGPFTASWNTTSPLVADGLYDVRTRVFDGSGNVASVTNAGVRIDNTDPVVSRTAPASGAAVRGTTVALAGTASDAGSGLATVEFVLSQAGTPKATLPAIAGAGATRTATLDSATLPDGTYDLVLRATDSALDGGGVANANSTTSIAIKVDNTSPTGSLTTAPAPGATVVGVVALASSSAADATSGVAGVTFEFAPTGTASWAPIGATDTTAPYGLNWDTTLLCDGIWDLRITVADVAGNTFSTTPISAVTTDNNNCTAAITAPAASSIQQGTISVSATASAATGDSVAGVAFQYRTSPAGAWTALGAPDTVAPYAVSFATGGVADGLYDLRANVTTANAKTGQSAPVTIRIDNLAPAAPLGFTATARTDGSVGLSWQAAVDAAGGSGIASYTVRRTAGAIAPISTIDGDAACSAVTGLACSDANVLTGRVYSYAVFAIDLAGHVSVAATATVTPRDTMAPDAPAGLSATPGDTTVQLAWAAATVDSDVTSYLLVAKAGRDVPVSENDGTRVCSAISSTSTGCTATGLTNGTTYTFALFAFDEALNRSLPGTVSSAPNGTPPVDKTPPSPVTDLAAAVSGTTVALSWKNPKDVDFDHVVVTSSKSGSVYEGPLEKTDVEQPLGKLRSYKVTAYDKSGNASTTVSVTASTASTGSGGGGTKFDGPVSPAHGERVLRKQVVLRWKGSKKASYYNIQIFDAKKKRVAIAWPHSTHWKVPSAKLEKGKKYTWYVWPGYGKLAKAKYGTRIGKATFRVK